MPDRPATPLRDQPHISISQLNSYLRCSMAYYFHYVLGRNDPPNLPLTAGKAGHRALEVNARHKISTGDDQPLEQILDVFSASYDQMVTDVEQPEPAAVGKTKDDTALGLQVYRSTVAPKTLPLLVEHEFLVELPTPEPMRPVLGYIDTVTLVDQVKRALGVFDYKFTNTRTTKLQLEVDIIPQLTMYDLVVEQMTGKPPAEIGLVQFMPPASNPLTHPPKVEVLRRSPAFMTTEARERRRAQLTYQFWTAERGIRAGIFLPTNDPKKCSYCGFRPICQESLVKSDYEAMQLRGEQ